MSQCAPNLLRFRQIYESNFGVLLKDHEVETKYQALLELLSAVEESRFSALGSSVGFCSSVTPWNGNSNTVTGNPINHATNPSLNG